MQPYALSLIVALGLLLLPMATFPVQAAPKDTTAPSPASPEPIGGEHGWNAYVDNEKKGKVCYLVGKPVKSEPATVKRGSVYALVTHRPSEKAANVVSIVAGYLFKEGGAAELDVDGHKFELFTEKDTAWARDAATDKAVVDALAKGKQAVFKGTSARGSATTDTFALAGFAQTLAQIDKACGIKR